MITHKMTLFDYQRLYTDIITCRNYLFIYNQNPELAGAGRVALSIEKTISKFRRLAYSDVLIQLDDVSIGEIMGACHVIHAVIGTVSKNAPVGVTEAFNNMLQFCRDVGKAEYCVEAAE